VKPREQGDWGELQALGWLICQGAKVSLPYGHSPDYDLIADLHGGLFRIQVKTTRCFRKGRWELTTCTRGGNQSWNGIVKRLDPKRYDYLFAAVADGRRWFLPARALGGGCGIQLGGPKYVRYEVESGPPMPDLHNARTAV
jgi:PD-(D/E)XK endonuclease